MLLRRHILFSRHATRAIALVTALVVLAGAIGIPVAAPTNKDLSQPFPCMHNACGCASAAACWQGCCCMTHEEKLVWAKRHQVTPPAGIVEVAHQRAKQGDGCCSSQKCDEETGEVSAGSLAVNLVRIEDYRKCHGQSSLWLVLSQALLPRAAAAFQTERIAVAWPRHAAAGQVSSPAFDPATPPPRAAISI